MDCDVDPPQRLIFIRIHTSFPVKTLHDSDT